MSDIAIRVENLGKLYRIGQRERYYTLRDSLANLFTAPFRCLSGNSKFAIGIRPLRQRRPPLQDKPLISFTDLTSMVIMREHGIPLVLTEDEHFLQVGMGFSKVPPLSR